MISPAEIRIGNRLRYKAEVGLCFGMKAWVVDKEIEVYEISRFGVNLINGNGYEYRFLLGIPLNDQCLERIGFDKKYIDGQIYFSFNAVDIAKSNSSDGYFLVTEDAYEGTLYWLGNSFNFVHQLQNLYFALRGEELPTKETA